MSDLPALPPTPELTPANPTPVTPSVTPISEATSLIGSAEPAPGGPSGEAPIPFQEWTEETFKTILPDGVEYAEDGMKLINDLKLGKESTEKLIAYQTKLMQEAAVATATDWVKQCDKWVSETKALPEIGGENLEKTLAKVREGVMKYGGEAALKALNTTGGGNHPALISLLHKAFSAIPSEPSPPGSGTPFKSERSLAERLFPSHGDNK